MVGLGLGVQCLCLKEGFCSDKEDHGNVLICKVETSKGAQPGHSWPAASPCRWERSPTPRHWPGDWLAEDLCPWGGKEDPSLGGQV